MSARRWNWQLWAGFGCALAALVLYFAFFLATRSVFWPCLTLSMAGALLLISGLQHAFRDPQSYRGKVAGPILAGLSVLIFAGFGFVSYQVFKEFPAARKAPRVGQAAPEFTLTASTGKNVSLAQLLASPVGTFASSHAPKGVLVVFYRGYW